MPVNSRVFPSPGIPPIFASVILYVADKEGFFKKYGANVEIRPFDTGTAAARAVIAGDIDMALSPSALVINQVSNTGVGLVAIYGMVNSDIDATSHNLNSPRVIRSAISKSLDYLLALYLEFTTDCNSGQRRPRV